jgi:hypothetical protein
VGVHCRAGVVLRRCVLKSEVGPALFCARTGVMVCHDCKVLDCRASGVVVGQGGVVEWYGGEVSNCRGFGAVALGGCKLLVGSWVWAETDRLIEGPGVCALMALCCIHIMHAHPSLSHPH